MAENAINKIEGADGNRISLLRNINDDLDDALRRPLSPSDTKNREVDAKIATELISHGWGKEDIRKVLHKRNVNAGYGFGSGGDSHLDSVLTDAGLRGHRSDSDDSEDSSGVTTDSDSDIDASRFSDIKF